MVAVLISGGAIEEEFAVGFLDKCKADQIIAVDRGLTFCKRYGIRPNCIVGDFDSLPGGILEEYEKDTDIMIKRLIPEKDDSDSECAMHLAMDMGAEIIYLLGGMGTRLDHVMANLQLLAYARVRGVKMYMADAHNLITVLDGTTVLKRENQFGDYVSFFSLGDGVTDVTLRGFRYPLTDYRLTNTSCGLTVSNEIAEEEATVSFSEGLLVMIQSKD